VTVNRPATGYPPTNDAKEERMANPAPVGSDVSAGTYECLNCGYELSLQSAVSLPPCPNCDGPYEWNALSGGDARDDPYPVA
jgi:hypothetical protein